MSELEEYYESLRAGLIKPRTGMSEQPDPQLAMEDRPVEVHIAGPTLTIFGNQIRQRCSWCGKVLVEYDLNRVAVPVGQEGAPSGFPFESLVRVDGVMSTVIDNPEMADEHTVRLPPDACAFDVRTHVQ